MTEEPNPTPQPLVTPSIEVAASRVTHRGERQTETRRRLFPHALAVGLLSGAIAVIFRIVLEKGETWRTAFLSEPHSTAVLPMIILAAIVMIGLSWWLVARVCPEATGSGIPHLRLTLRNNGQLRWWRILPVKFFSGYFAIVSGLCLGREGPTLQMGAALGEMWGNSHVGKSADRRSLMVTGASAGLAAAFNAPMAAIMFAIEELRINIPDAALFAVMISSVAADLLARTVLGQTPVLQAHITTIPPLESLPFFVVLGGLSALISAAFNTSLIAFTKKLAFSSRRKNLAKVVLAGLVISLFGWWDDSLLGGGLPLSNRALEGQGTVSWLATMVVLRFVLSVGSYAIGTAGGIFAPLLVIGGLSGLIVGELCRSLMPAAVPEASAFAVVGMAALFSGVVRCPLTGIILIVEMTGHYDLILPLMVSSFTASIVTDELRVKPVYDALIDVQLERIAKLDAANTGTGAVPASLPAHHGER